MVDILASAARQHLRRDEPWKICGAGLAAWFLMTRLVVIFLHSRTALPWYWSGGFLIVLAAGAWRVTRGKAGILQGTVASAKTAVVGQTGTFMKTAQSPYSSGVPSAHTVLSAVLNFGQDRGETRAFTFERFRLKGIAL